jgi:hypothetical protein
LQASNRNLDLIADSTFWLLPRTLILESSRERGCRLVIDDRLSFSLGKDMKMIEKVLNKCKGLQNLVLAPNDLHLHEQKQIFDGLLNAGE